MNSKLYRCGWCGCPTNAQGGIMNGEFFKRNMHIHTYYDTSKHTHLTEGECCPYGDKDASDNMVQITRDMAIDAGDRSLEGQWIKW